MRFPEFAFVDYARGGVSKRNNVVELLEALADSRNGTPPDVYITVHRFPAAFRDHVARTGSVREYDGPSWADYLVWDIDSDGLEAARRAALALSHVLRERYDVGSQLRTFFSGAKGFHLLVPSQLLGDLEPSPELAGLLRTAALRIAEEADAPVDPRIYDRVRLLRVGNTQHSGSGLYKIELTSDELGELSTDEIRRLARRPREIGWEPHDLEPREALEDLLVRIAEEGAEEDSGRSCGAGDDLVDALARAWGDERHYLALAFGGWASAHLPRERALGIVEAVARIRGDEELEDRLRAVGESFDRARAGHPVRGYADLRERMDPAGLAVLDGYSRPAKQRPDVDQKAPGPDPDRTEPLTLTDSGNATRLAELHGLRLHYIAPWGKWVTCAADGFWSIDHKDVRVRELAKDVGRGLKLEAAEEADEDRAKKLFAFGLSSLNAHKIGAMVDLARGIQDIPLGHEQIDANGWLLGVENGVIDLRTGELRSAEPRDLLTRRCPVTWDPTGEAPRWTQALGEWFPDPDVAAYVQRVAGAALVGEQRDHVFVIHYGIGGNGKGTFTKAIQGVLGPYAMVVHLSLLVETKHTEHDTVKAQLFRARLAVAAETERRVRLNESSVKNLTGGDRITARRMREDPWEFDPTHSLWLQTNHLPEISGRDAGIWRRIRVVEWVNLFKGNDEDRGLKDKLAAEAPGILRWMVEGCLEWQREGLHEPGSVLRSTLEYRAKEDVLSRFAQDVGLVFRNGIETPASELQEALSQWASAEGILTPSRDLPDWLRENGARQIRQRYTDPSGNRRQHRVWIGVGVEDGAHESVQTIAL